ncbi:hypothetical protein DZC30_18785 [Comamonas testosteroni]|uniref:Uncharacterized protein n=1 Tax=Comamonas testosteroni TaxID=285 RepID=A0A373FB23_COMTE|nr:hypothetical protein DZC30_18785 [Comamonas testosteroni]
MILGRALFIVLLNRWPALVWVAFRCVMSSFSEFYKYSYNSFNFNRLSDFLLLMSYSPQEEFSDSAVPSALPLPKKTL